MPLKKLIRILKIAVIVFFVSTVGSVLILRFVPVYVTPLMVINGIKNVFKGESPRWYHTWVPLSEINSSLPQAVVASEDNLFMDHWGFDFKQISKAIEDKDKKKKKRVRGASTISQQTAKNVFLWPGRSFIRKGFEAYFTLLIELMWGKERIMEVYLNSIEMGKNIYGAQAVAEKHFDKSAAKLTRSQSALIAATLPNPIRFDSSRPSAYILRRQQKILRVMRQIAPVRFD